MCVLSSVLASEDENLTPRNVLWVLQPWINNVFCRLYLVTSGCIVVIFPENALRSRIQLICNGFRFVFVANAVGLFKHPNYIFFYLFFLNHPFALL